MTTTILNTTQAAKHLNMSKQTLEAWRLRGGGPVYLKFGKAVRYREEDINTFIEKSVRHSTSEAV